MLRVDKHHICLLFNELVKQFPEKITFMGDVDLRRLAEMLDDPSENVAAGVMAELLRRGDEILDMLAEMQEAEDPLLRKRVHELETIAVLRRRRRDYLQKLESADFDLVQALIDLHLLFHAIT